MLVLTECQSNAVGRILLHFMGFSIKPSKKTTAEHLAFHHLLTCVGYLQNISFFWGYAAWRQDHIQHFTTIRKTHFFWTLQKRLQIRHMSEEPRELESNLLQTAADICKSQHEKFQFSDPNLLQTAADMNLSQRSGNKTCKNLISFLLAPNKGLKINLLRAFSVLVISSFSIVLTIATIPPSDCSFPTNSKIHHANYHITHTIGLHVQFHSFNFFFLPKSFTDLPFKSVA